MSPTCRPRLTSETILSLSDNEVLVVGTNLRGAHHMGMSRFAHEKMWIEFGTCMGFSSGLAGVPMRAYLISTKDWANNLLPLTTVHQQVKILLTVSSLLPFKVFVVTTLVQGSTAYGPLDLAPMFFNGLTNAEFIEAHPNITLPRSFWEVNLAKNEIIATEPLVPAH